MTAIQHSTRPPAGEPAAADALVESVKTALRARRAPVAIVSAFADGQPLGCVVSAFLSLSLRPPSLLVSLQHGSQTLDLIERSGRFGLSLLGGQQDHLIQTFSTGRATDRFAATRYDLSCGVPLIDGSPATFACALTRLVPMYDHVLVVGDVLRACSAAQAAQPVAALRKVAS